MKEVIKKWFDRWVLQFLPVRPFEAYPIRPRGFAQAFEALTEVKTGEPVLGADEECTEEE